MGYFLKPNSMDNKWKDILDQAQDTIKKQSEEIRQLRNKVIDETINSFDFGGMYTVPEIRKKLNSLKTK